MVDVVSTAKRSEIMSKIKHYNTPIETSIRKILWACGKRYRLHSKTVFGHPDISNKSKKVAVFLDGCFWHGCPKCPNKKPSSNKAFWEKKVEYNQKRRKDVKRRLRKEGWTVLEFWEHEIRASPKKIAGKIASKL